jgi:hypothetical protein
MKKRKIYTVIIRVVCPVVGMLTWMLAPSLGQENANPCTAASSENIAGSHLLSVPYRDLNPYKDLPGENNQWGKGTVYLNNGDSVSGRFLIYSSLGSNLLSVKTGTENIFLVEKSTVKGFTFHSEKNRNEVHSYRFFHMDPWFYSDGSGCFLEELVIDNLSLYYLATIEKFPMSDNLKEHHNYFIQLQGTGLKKIRPNRHSLCRTLNPSKEFVKHLYSLPAISGKRERIISAVWEYNKFIKGEQH